MKEIAQASWLNTPWALSLTPGKGWPGQSWGPQGSLAPSASPAFLGSAWGQDRSRPSRSSRYKTIRLSSVQSLLPREPEMVAGGGRKALKVLSATSFDRRGKSAPPPPGGSVQDSEFRCFSPQPVITPRFLHFIQGLGTTIWHETLPKVESDQIKGLVFNSSSQRVWTWACCVQSLAASQIRTQNCAS